MTAKTPDFAKLAQDFLGAYPVDTAAFEDGFKTSAALGEKLSKVALDAASKSTEISTMFAKQTLAKMGDASRVKAEPADYAKSATDFASAQAEAIAETLSAFAEIAKKVQIETVELMLASGKNFSEDASAAVKKATADVTSAAKKAAAAAK